MADRAGVSLRPLGRNILGDAALIEPKPVSGLGPDAAWLNRLREYVRSIRLLPGPGYLISQTPAGIVLSLRSKSGGAVSLSVSTLYLLSVSGDYITCTAQDSSHGLQKEIYVAKPFKLREKIASENKFGAIYNYTYGAGPDDLNRYRTSALASNAADTETE